jgi:predicted ATPase
VLRIASAAGRRVSHRRLAAVSGLPDDDLEQALREAAAHHVLVAASTDPGGFGSDDGYHFRHALLREAIYHELLPGERSRLHARYAELLAVPGGTGPRGVAEPGRAAELAHHAMAGHDLRLAFAASVQAAMEADDREAPAEALLHSERAIELWRTVPDAEALAGVDEGSVTRARSPGGRRGRRASPVTPTAASRSLGAPSSSPSNAAIPPSAPGSGRSTRCG